MTLTDHISKEMNELNVIRCQRIPKRPGADWRDLPDEKVLNIPIRNNPIVKIRSVSLECVNSYMKYCNS